MSTVTEVAVRETLVSTNPATGEILRELACATTEDVHEAVRRARAAQPAWQALPVRQRLKVLKEFQRKLTEKRIEIAELISREAGKPTVEALNTEVIVVLDATEFCLRKSHRFLRDEPLPHDNLAMKTKRGKLVREPYGVIGIIAPWNYPFSTPAIETLGALAMGNAVVLKPSEFTPLVALEFQKLMYAAGLNPYLLQVLIGGGPVGGALLEADIDKVIFTGSVATGKRIAEAAAKRLLPVVLELGSKDPMIVLEDADLEATSSGAVWGAMMNCGQTCLSIERCYVHRSVYERFLELCKQKIERLRIGEGLGSEVEVGPLIHERQLCTVEDHVNDAVAQGARLLTGGKRLPELGPNFYAPTLLADVQQDMRIMREETFGPALPVAPFDTEEDAVRLANDTQFGLAASVWTSNSKRGEAIARRIRAGTVMVNDAISAFGIAEAPHGGFEQSGIGRAHGEMGLAEMVLMKYVDVDLLPRMPKVWWYGYSKKFQEQMSGFVDMLFGRGLGPRIKGAISATGALLRKNRV
jgi:succinate-semialdehyde dehydrogenase/glutarate-semialdehyde dehydrogenase